MDPQRVLTFAYRRAFGQFGRDKILERLGEEARSDVYAFLHGVSRRRVALADLQAIYDGEKIGLAGVFGILAECAIALERDPEVYDQAMPELSNRGRPRKTVAAETDAAAAIAAGLEPAPRFNAMKEQKAARATARMILAAEAKYGAPLDEENEPSSTSAQHLEPKSASKGPPRRGTPSPKHPR